MISIDYKIKNEINGIKYTIIGEGEIHEDGVKTISGEISGIPRHWSGTLIPCICSGPGEYEEEITSSPPKCLIAFAPKGYSTEKGTLRRATLWDESGRVIARVTATGSYRRLSRGMDYDINVHTETETDSIASRLVNVDHYGFIIAPNGAGRAKVITQYSLSTLSGERAFGTTSISYKFIGSRATVPETIIGRNSVKVQQMGRQVQWAIKQNTEFESNLGAHNTAIVPLS